MLFAANSQSNERLTTTETRTNAIPSCSNNTSASLMGAKNVLNTATPTIPQSSSKFARESTNQSKATTNNGEDDLDSVHLMLEPHLRPEPLDPNSSFSKQIFDEHKALAKEYLKVCVHFKFQSIAFIQILFNFVNLGFQVHTEIAYVKKHRDELLAAMNPEERQKRLDYFSKLKEKVSLSIRFINSILKITNLPMFSFHSIIGRFIEI